MSSLANKVLLVGTFVFALGLVVVDTPTSADPPDPIDPLAEPVTGDPADGYPEPGFETGPIHPFDPLPAHPSDAPIESLTEDEQAYIEANIDTSAWPAIHNAFSAATTQAAEGAEAQAAATLVGLDGFQNAGVVP